MMKIFKFLRSGLMPCFLVSISLVSCSQTTSDEQMKPLNKEKSEKNMNTLELVTLAGGCFWCVEAIYQDVIGIEKVVSGYMGGATKNPTYKDICTGRTGHAEVVQISYDPSQISYEEILNIFWHTHNPTTLNRQGNDVGTQYRSAIFYHNAKQKELAERSKKEINQTDLWANPIVTEIAKASTFYSAEAYHQDYFKTNPNQGYCQAVIEPKVAKFRKNFKDKLKN